MPLACARVVRSSQMDATTAAAMITMKLCR